MATLDATVGGPDANAYLPVAEATEWLSMRLDAAAWVAAPAFEQAQALMQGTALIEQQCHWYGTPTTLAQALSWPQTGQVDPRGRPVPSDSIPGFIEQATALAALLLLQEQTVMSTLASTGAVKSRKLGDTQITYHDPQTSARTTGRSTPTLSAEIRALLRPYAQMGGGITVPLLRT
jgi:hypothetical protein